MNMSSGAGSAFWLLRRINYAVAPQRAV
jgi:hypothetical protein